MTVTGGEDPPTIESAAAQLGVRVDDVDADFGVVSINPAAHLYAVRVRADRLPARDLTEEPYRGPFEDPKIEPLAPRRHKSD